jgi:L-arabinokinase
MGGIADYSGALVLQMPLRERSTVSVTLRTDGLVRVRTAEPLVSPPSFELPYAQLLPPSGQVDYAYARARLRQHPGGDWAAYVVGCLLGLQKELDLAITGADFWVSSQVPVGKGVSSSAALEVATLRALEMAYQVRLPGTQLARLAQAVENQVVGAPCGLMDQLASCFGEPGQLLPILCQPDRLQPLVPLPPDVHFVGIDSGVRHAVSGASYTQVRVAAFMGYSFIASQLGYPTAQLRSFLGAGQRGLLPGEGYLANVPLAHFERQWLPHLPEVLRGADFLAAHGPTIDPATEVQPDQTYPVRAATAHPVREHVRVKRFIELLSQWPTGAVQQAAQLKQLGQLMYAAHAGYASCGLGNPRTDELVAAVQTAQSQGLPLYGAKITGGGSGGTVCVLAHGEAGLAAAHQLHQSYQAKYGPVAWFSAD